MTQPVDIPTWMYQLDNKGIAALPHGRLAEMVDTMRFSQAANAWVARKEAARRLTLLGEIGPS